MGVLAWFWSFGGGVQFHFFQFLPFPLKCSKFLRVNDIIKLLIGIIDRYWLGQYFFNDVVIEFECKFGCDLDEVAAFESEESGL